MCLKALVLLLRNPKTMYSGGKCLLIKRGKEHEEQPTSTEQLTSSKQIRDGIQDLKKEETMIDELTESIHIDLKDMSSDERNRR